MEATLCPDAADIACAGASGYAPDMPTLTMYQVDAFADRVFTGNPAAVLVLDDWLDEALMASIAMENNLAETAFARRGQEGFDLRWFTPVHEVAFCGHATLATAHVLATEYGVSGEIAFATARVGTLRVRPEGDGAYTLDVPCLAPEPLDPVPGIFQSLFPGGWRAAFRNFENLFVELASEAEVRAYVPDLVRIAELHPTGLVITAKCEDAPSGRGGADFVSRYFVPGAGIPEDPVTGSTHATLVPYWAQRLGTDRLSAVQASRRGGRLTCRLEGGRVFLTGRAVTFMRAVVFLPKGEVVAGS